MVYRGKISAGCTNCRRAKKRCGLERPACSRCVKAGRTCSGYRDTTQLQIEDESEATIARVHKKANELVVRPRPDGASQTHMERDHSTGLRSSKSTSSSPSSSVESAAHTSDGGLDSLGFFSFGAGMIFPLVPRIEDITTASFFGQFVSATHWDLLQASASRLVAEPCLDYAIRACGMAAINNTNFVPQGKHYATQMYGRALGLVNAALRDSKKCTKDECLLAIAMLSYYENITCDSPQSVQSWKIHVQGATQLLRLRGRAQLQSAIGRLLFRETRALIIINCIWEEMEPPAFLWDWGADLTGFTTDHAQMTQHADDLTRYIYDYACLRASIKQRTIGDIEAAHEIARIDRVLTQWSDEALTSGGGWEYTEMEVPDSPHVWNGVVLDYASPIAATLWNTYRIIKIMVTRTQELLCERFDFSRMEQVEQQVHFRKIRRQMTDEICATIPRQLGHAAPASNSSSILVTAYSSIWPLFFAGTCALERLGVRTVDKVDQQNVSAAAAQVAWILGRMDYISTSIGFRWAQGIAASLRGDFRMHNDLIEEYD